MNVYIYDKTFDGLLTAVFDAYFRKTFPDFLLSEGDALPLFCIRWSPMKRKPPVCGVACRRKSLLPRLAASPSVGCRNCRI